MRGGRIQPYGDTRGDGMVQLSFTLPLPHGPLAEADSVQLVTKMGLDPAAVVHSTPVGPEFTFVVVYGSVTHTIDLDEVRVLERDYPLLSPTEVNARVRAALRRKLVVIGACVGTDAHTVGIDAILNVKGFAGQKGLEYYRELRVINLGAQVAVSDLLGRARQERADAVLISQVVTQRDAHLRGIRETAHAFQVAWGQHRPRLVAGGPRSDPMMAGELGVDRVFSRGTTPGEVASYLVHALTKG